jgi:hypothetical protein
MHGTRKKDKGQEMKKLRALLFIGLAMLFTASPCEAAEPTSPTLEEIEKALLVRPFKDVGSVAVVVEDVGEEGEKAGLSKHTLKNHIELKLRQSGIPVRNIDTHTLEDPYVYLNLAIAHFELIDRYACSILLELKQRVRLLRNDEILHAITWRDGGTAFAPSGKVRTGVTEAIDSYLELFMDGYFRANPRTNLQPEKKTDTQEELRL